MYTFEGKPVQPDYGRKSTTVSKQEFENLKEMVLKLMDELEALKPKTATAENELEDLKSQAILLGIDVKFNWGVKRLTQAIDEALASKD